MKKKTIGIFAFVMVSVLAIGMVSAFGGFGKEISDENREAIDAAIESGNFESWKSLMQSQITQERFDEMKVRHQKRAEFRALIQEARESGDYSRIQELKAEFGQGREMHEQNMNFGECPFTK